MKKNCLVFSLCLCVILAGVSVATAKDIKAGGGSVQHDTATAGVYGAGEEGMKADEQMLEEIEKVKQETEDTTYSDSTPDDK